ncbi:FlgD Ig-like domain-containing protein [Desulfonema limicola]|uniref:FlgD Ig-like domain-containing protein n=1 Tax=Desulfonema limicola TaxID=45656 RepID=A0A975B5X1_9BACT|nr:hypothetical protein [Desulfonema limicola]QTA79403.1 FlgD Ig-like domain-containing protein [Desulfonema limicola]
MKKYKISVLFLILFTAYSALLFAQQELSQPHALTQLIDNKPLFGKILSEVKLSKTSFNPSLGEEIAVSFMLSESAEISLNIYDPDHGLINSIAEKKQMPPGKQLFLWNGKDTEGKIVPDESYYFTIIAENKAGNIEIYDPTLFSGGKEYEIRQAKINHQDYTISYNMTETGRVMIRLGIKEGPLMNQLIDWEPRERGAVTEYWNGKDKDGLSNIYSHPDFKMVIIYFTLPENSVITFGNKTSNYRDYKKAVASYQKQKDSQYKRTDNEMLSMHYRLLRTEDYSPKLNLSFSNIHSQENGITILKEKTMVKVEIDEKDKSVFQNLQYEICFFLDYKFYVEEETGYTPFNWVWDLKDVEPGEYILTVNVSGFKDQIGIMSKKIKVVK